MKPFSIYYSRQQDFTEGQQHTVQQIVAIAHPEAIYLLGGSRRSRRSESIFNPEAPSSRYVADCFYLVLVPEGGSKTAQQWQDQLEHAVSGLPFTALVLYASRFTNWIQEGHPFACKVQELAPLLYKSPGYEGCNLLPGLPTVSTETQEKEHAAAMHRAREFMAGAALYQLRTEYKLAAFMLHQAMEQSLRSLLQAGTGYYANLHNLERLLRYASLVSWQLPDVFNTAFPENRQLFRLLQKAYVGARYEKDFCIKNSELHLLQTKVRHIIDIAGQTGLQNIRREAVTLVQPLQTS